MMSRIRKTLLLGVAGVVTASAVGVAVAQAAPHTAAPAAASTAAADMPSTVESFAYPGAAKIVQDQQITLKRGDGHILLTDCSLKHDIQVESRIGKNYYCFSVSGKQGFLTLELPDVYFLWNKELPVQAKVTADGETTVVNAPAAKPGQENLTHIGETSNSGKPSVLLELRVTG
ncbi:hypothetical protein LE181_27650 [Streptomyces sp. SCA3-4]|uniref:hypothetical protein n=1 Tax=Streptomyces sichuanensis TaxID=2871810 RepID=UPI001CE26502|nr:hypothetical protein [Streptomyces sichuanensis]MCA6095925.1 hypothetical protein [Streptomyces sichuanensis]